MRIDLLDFARENGLPVLDRKWDKINTEKLEKPTLKAKILSLLESGNSPKTIVEALGCSESYVSMVKTGRRY